MNALDEMLYVIGLAEAYWTEIERFSSGVRKEVAKSQIVRMKELRTKFESGEFKIEVPAKS